MEELCKGTPLLSLKFGMNLIELGRKNVQAKDLSLVQGERCHFALPNSARPSQYNLHSHIMLVTLNSSLFVPMNCSPLQTPDVLAWLYLVYWNIRVRPLFLPIPE